MRYFRSVARRWFRLSNRSEWCGEERERRSITEGSIDVSESKVELEVEDDAAEGGEVEGR